MENTPNPHPAFPADGLFEYLLVVSPNKAVTQQIIDEKLYFSNSYKQSIAKKTHPHITVANFVARDEMEDTLIRWLQRIVGEQKGFSVTLNNYGGFPDHTIFLRILDPVPFGELASQLKPIDFYIRSNGCPSVKFIRNPHLSIARRLPAMVYQKAMIDYAQKTFNESFDVTELVLLRRQHQYDSCKQVAIFRLQPQEIIHAIK